MSEISRICSATSEICPAREALIEAIEHHDATALKNESGTEFEPQVTEQYLTAHKILNEAKANCFGDECWVIKGLVRALLK